MSKKVIEILPSLSDGGAESLVKEYCKFLIEDKFDVDLVTLYKFKNTANSNQISKIKINDYYSVFGSYSFLNRVVNLFLGRWLVPIRLKRYIRKEKPDCIHIHLTMLKYLYTIADELTDIKLIYTCHSEPERYFVEGNAEMQAAEYLIRHNNLQLIALHEDMRKKLNTMFAVDNTIVIHNGIDLDRFMNKRIDTAIKRASIEIPQDAFVVGHIGRFIPIKNHSFLIDVFNEIAKQRTDAFLLMIGWGELRADIENKLSSYGLANKYLILENRSDIPELLQIMDVFILPSFVEGLPVSLVEAQAAGLKCIITNSINHESILSENTIIVDVHDEPSNWAKITLDTTVRNSEYGNIEVFDLSKEIKKIEKLYFS